MALICMVRLRKTRSTMTTVVTGTGGTVVAPEGARVDGLLLFLLPRCDPPGGFFGNLEMLSRQGTPLLPANARENCHACMP